MKSETVRYPRDNISFEYSMCTDAGNLYYLDVCESMHTTFGSAGDAVKRFCLRSYILYDYDFFIIQKGL